MGEATLLIRLAGPIQAWHVHMARTYDRASARSYAREDLMPTRSGILGLLACAQGRPRDADMADLCELDIVVRVDQPGEARAELKTSRRRNTVGQVVGVGKSEMLLHDAVFVAGISGPRSLLDAIYDALGSPVWAPYLGQKAYPPTHPLRLAVADEPIETAVRSQAWMAGDWYRPGCPAHVTLRLYRPRIEFGGGRRRWDDLPPVLMPNPDGRGEPEHDPFAALS